MNSFIQPVRPIDTAPPWGWNPGATFVEAYNASKLTKQKAEEMRLANELEAILLPVKQKQAALALDKMQFDVELQSARLDQERIATKQAYKALKDSLSGSGASSNVAGNVGSSNQAGVYQSRFGFGSKLTPPATSAPQAAQPVTRKVGSGLMPKNS